MKKIFTILLILVSTSVFAQKLEVETDFYHRGAFPAKDCPNDNSRKPCAVIDVILPGVLFSVSSGYKINETEIPNGKRIFISTDNNQKIRVDADGFLPFKFDAPNLTGMELYEIVLRKPEYKQETSVVENKDQNTGKAYLMLKISEPDAEVYVNGQTYKVNGRERNLNLPYGTYNVRVLKPTFETETFSVTLSKEPVEKNITLKVATVQIKVEKEKDAYLYVDGRNYGQYQDVVPVTADKRHKIKIEKNGYSKSKTVKAYRKPFTVVMPSLSQTNAIQSDWFIGYNYSSTAPINFSIGRCKRFGFILNGGFSPLTFCNYVNRIKEHGNILDTFRIKHIYYEALLDNDQLHTAKSKGAYRCYVRLGPVIKTFNFLYFYATFGYGNSAEVKQYDGMLFSPDIHKGVEGEAGLMLKYRRLGISLGYTQNIDKEIKFSEYNFGLHYWMKVQTKHINPLNRFFVGYKYTFGAPFGISLGASFGYYEKWGLIINAGSSSYLMEEGMMLGYYSFEGKEAKGLCRSYYHFGPFFRLNDIFSYYVTIGYGSYKPTFESIWGGQYSCGWDGEAGIILKYQRLGLSIGYQHSISKKKQFQDISIGAYVWLGR